MTIEEHATLRPSAALVRLQPAWEAMHPTQPGADPLQSAMDSLADCWNYIGASDLSENAVWLLQAQIAGVHRELEWRRDLKLRTGSPRLPKWYTD